MVGTFNELRELELAYKALKQEARIKIKAGLYTTKDDMEYAWKALAFEHDILSCKGLCKCCNH